LHEHGQGVVWTRISLRAKDKMMNPPEVRSKLAPRVRKLSEYKSVEERIQALEEIVNISKRYLEHLTEEL